MTSVEEMMFYSLLDYYLALLQLISGVRVIGEKKITENSHRDINVFLSVSNQQRILDITKGCLCFQCTHLKSKEYNVTGFDIENRRQLGLGASQHLLARFLYGLYAGYNPDAHKTLVCVDFIKMPFTKYIFDLAPSVSAIELILDSLGLIPKYIMGSAQVGLQELVPRFSWLYKVGIISR